MHVAIATHSPTRVLTPEALLFPVPGTLLRFSPFGGEKSSVSPRRRKIVWGRGCGEPSISLLTSIFPPAKAKKKVYPVVQKPGVPVQIGIDLAVRGLEVRKLFYAAFARGLAKDGYDPEEALQEVYRGLLTRNKGTCPFDSRKSSFGHYVHIVTRCILANYIRKEKRRLQFESNESSLSIPGGESGFSIETCEDARSSRIPDSGSLKVLSQTIKGGGVQVETALRLLCEGYSRREVVDQLQVEPKWLDGILVQAKATLLGR